MTRRTGKKHKAEQMQKFYLLLFVICSFVLFLCLLLIYFLPRTSLWNRIQNPPSKTDEYPDSQELPDVSGNEATTPSDVSGNQTQVSPPDVSDPSFESGNAYAGYDFSKPVPVSTAVDLSYFDDAVFIGDSRTEGFILNLNLSQIKSFTHKGLMVNTVFTKNVIDLGNRKTTVMDALKETPFSKVYIMLGINELGWAYSSKFIEKYSEIIDEIKVINPEAIIYIQSLLPVSQEVSDTHNYLKNDKIKEYNALLSQLAAEKEVFFLDTAAAVIDANGCLPSDAATDGIHLKKAYCEKWLQYLETHALSVSDS